MSYQPNPYAFEEMPERPAGPALGRFTGPNRPLTVAQIADAFGADALTPAERAEHQSSSQSSVAGGSPFSTAHAQTTADCHPDLSGASTGRKDTA